MADTNTEPKVIELDPEVWMRGTSGHLLTMVGQRRQQCCIGVACTAMGTPDSAIYNEVMIGELPPDIVPPDFYKIATVEVEDFTEDEYIADDNLQRIYNINDAAEMSDEARVEEINQELARLKATFRFALKVKA